MRLSEISSKGRDFTVIAEDDVFRFRFSLRGGPFSSQGRAAKAGLALARRSAQMFLDAEVVALAISAHVNRGEHGRAANTLDSRISAARLLAMIVPNSHADFRTGSGALDEHYHKMTAEWMGRAALLAVRRAPITMNNGEGAFLTLWGRASVPQLLEATHGCLDVVGVEMVLRTSPEGAFSMYIDAVSMTAGPSSWHPELLRPVAGAAEALAMFRTLDPVPVRGDAAEASSGGPAL